MNILYILGLIAIGIIIGYQLRPGRSRETHRLLHSLIYKLSIMAEKTDKALQDLEAINAQLQKIGNETAITLQKVADLEAAANGDPDTPQSVLDKIAEVKTQAQIVDDLTPDAETPPA